MLWIYDRSQERITNTYEKALLGQWRSRVKKWFDRLWNTRSSKEALAQKDHQTRDSHMYCLRTRRRQTRNLASDLEIQKRTETRGCRYCRCIIYPVLVREIWMARHEPLAQAQLWQVWLGGLLRCPGSVPGRIFVKSGWYQQAWNPRPCQEDDSEGERNHKKLLELIQQEWLEGLLWVFSTLLMHLTRKGPLQKSFDHLFEIVWLPLCCLCDRLRQADFTELHMFSNSLFSQEKPEVVGEGGFCMLLLH